jgi:hypothetical protein
VYFQGRGSRSDEFCKLLLQSSRSTAVQAIIVKIRVLGNCHRPQSAGNPTNTDFLDMWSQSNCYISISLHTLLCFIYIRLSIHYKSARSTALRTSVLVHVSLLRLSLFLLVDNHLLVGAMRTSLMPVITQQFPRTFLAFLQHHDSSKQQFVSYIM